MTATVAGIHLGIDTHANRPAANAVPDGSIYSCSTHSLVYKSNYAGNSWATWATLGGTGLTDPMTTRGDLIVRDSSNTTARLAVGSANKFLHTNGTDPAWAAVLPADLDVSADNTTADATTGHHGLLPKLDSSASKYLDGSGVWSTPAGGGISSGTSNPGSPSNGDLFYRSDLDLLIRYRSSGTRWVCTCLHVAPMMLQTVVIPQSATGSMYAGIDTTGRDLYVERVALGTIVPSGTNNATNYWTIDTLNGPAFGSIDTKTDGNTGTRHDLPNTGLVLSANTVYIELRIVKTLSPGNLYAFPGGMIYRYIVT